MKDMDRLGTRPQFVKLTLPEQSLEVSAHLGRKIE